MTDETPDALLQGLKIDADPSGPSSPPVIPIIERSRHARKTSQKLSAISPVCVLVVGMAGSGKTTLMSALQRSVAPPKSNNEDEPLKSTKQVEVEECEQSDDNDASQVPVGYCLNLDPATKLVPFGASIDIRDTIDYKEVMKQHKLGPNGAIMTCLNLYATKFDQVLSILDQRAFKETKSAGMKEGNNTSPSTPPPPPKNIDYILVDTPGQIEAFTWSASGTMITTALASSFPTVLAFVVDTPRCTASLNTFMSNMLYACSMYYRSRLPLVVVFNKTDVMSGEVCMEWMNDYELFQEALDDFIAGDGAGYYASLTRSLSLVLDEFYSTLHKVGVSAATGEGVDQFWDVVQKASEDFDEEYVADLECRIEEQVIRKKAIALDSMKRIENDLKRDGAV